MSGTNSQVDATLTPVPEESAYPAELALEEEKRNGRRPRVGFALSGGGIRSATLSLGFFQGLAALGVLKYADILSTVSGGGYFGGFYGHLVQREADKKRAKKPPEPVGRELADEVLKDADAPWVKFLRDNGRYLSPNGAGDLFAAASVALRNWFAVLLVLTTFALFALTSLTLFRLGVEQRLGEFTSLQVQWPVIWLSPWFIVAAIALPVLAVPPGWAYWLVRDNPPFQGAKPWLARWAAPIGIVGFALYLLVPRLREWRQWSLADWSVAVLGVTTLLTIGRFFVGRWSEANEPEVQRTHLSRGFARALTSIIALLLVATFDSVGLAIVKLSNSGLVALSGGTAAVVGIFRKPLMNFVTGLGKKERPRISTELLALVASVVLLLITIGGLASIPYFVAHGRWLPTAHPASLSEAAYIRLFWLAALTLLTALATAILRPFVNRSSLHALYESRLRRAYMGATNPARLGEGDSFPAMSAPHKDDAIAWCEYDPSQHGGPLHLINVTINETVHGRSQVEQRDRKGLAMAIGPAGVSVGRKYHALWQYKSLGSFTERIVKDGKNAMQRLSGAFNKKDEEEEPQKFRIFPSVAHPELLDVAQWLAISGGAVSTGLGARTSASLSVLLGFFNVRLGYWWRSGVTVADRKGVTGLSRPQRALGWVGRLFPVQMSLLDEWSARFPGVARSDWYLTDGGHFENLGAYELVRRRLPLMIVCDFEADPDYAYGGLGNLVRKARIDFGTEITFLSEEQVRGNDAAMTPPFRLPSCVGTLEALRRGHRSAESVKPVGGEEARQRNDGANDGLSLVHGALAHVRYPDMPGAAVQEGWLLYVKASLDGDEPADVLQYHTDHPLFPQESTADQFFDESQWESYRCLGEHMASEVFAEKSLREWMPAGVKRHP